MLLFFKVWLVLDIRNCKLAERYLDYLCIIVINGLPARGDYISSTKYCKIGVLFFIA